MTDLNGKTAIITGASRGIGAATARRLAASGANVVLAARSKGALKNLAKDLKAEGANALAVACDVAKFRDVEAVAAKVLKDFGSVDILVNNAGVIDPIARIGDSDPAEWGRAIDVNVKGVYHGMRAVIPAMTKGAGGVIVNISSGAANSALEGWSHYCSSKAAAKKLTECGHGEVSEQNIRVVGLSPGTVATEMMAKIKDSGVNPVSQLDWSSHIPPEWAAQAVLFLCGSGGAEFAGKDFSLKTEEGRKKAGLPLDA